MGHEAYLRSDLGIESEDNALGIYNSDQTSGAIRSCSIMGQNPFENSKRYVHTHPATGEQEDRPKYRTGYTAELATILCGGAEHSSDGSI